MGWSQIFLKIAFEKAGTVEGESEFAAYEKQIIRPALERYGSYTAAGRALGITHKTVAAKAQKYGIRK